MVTAKFILFSFKNQVVGTVPLSISSALLTIIAVVKVFEEITRARATPLLSYR
jgi:hypothetical protein